MTENHYNAILFDMDGVLVDSEKVITKAALLCLTEFGINASEADFKPFTGMGEDRFIGGVAEKYGAAFVPQMKARTYQIYESIVKDEIYIYPGVLKTLEALKQSGLSLALASSADMIKVRANLRVAGIGFELFDAVLTGESVTDKKPDPAIYLLAAQKCGFPPQNCLVVEDAVSGVLAAKSAGCACAAVTTSFDAKTLKAAGADYIIPEISHLRACLAAS